MRQRKTIQPFAQNPRRYCFLQQAYKAKGRHCGHEMFSFFLLRWFGILTGAPVFEHFVEGARQFVSALLIA